MRFMFPCLLFVISFPFFNYPFFQVHFVMLRLLLRLFAFCIAGSSITGYKLGHAAGIENCLNYLQSQGLIEFDDEEFEYED